jgi:hypothetical protein
VSCNIVVGQRVADNYLKPKVFLVDASTDVTPTTEKISLPAAAPPFHM